ncbi:methyl-CpG-binding domain-containing protein 7 isoform X1 [Mercurialis annua]|uniref:methyl-CpG-binding domain-containing protein 7 isoform X1 n=1 Tax=Mercurialis annua TaxID=3986 RepID=UPI002160997C|nr:methyl-CpG-binding domain-containing protein 7 isoform X1 [Mercurialis annua]
MIHDNTKEMKRRSLRLIQSQHKNRNRNKNKQLQIVGSSPFNLPDDWLVEKRRRRTSGRYDKYYYEPGSEQQFRSLLSVQKYLSGEIYFAPKRRKSSNETNMQIVPRSCSSFNLPDGWIIKEKRRSNVNYAGVIDRYFYEPGSEQKFRSLLSVQKYLSGEINSAPKRLKSSNETNMQSVPRSCSSFNLPDGWIIEEKPRSNVDYAGVIDRCYIEPETGKRFRSLISVQRYLAKGKEYAAAPKPLKLADNVLYLTDGRELAAMNNVLKLRENANFETSVPNNGNPPAKIKWVLSPCKISWSAFMDDSLVPDSEVNKWSETFLRIFSDS